MRSSFAALVLCLACNSKSQPAEPPAPQPSAAPADQRTSAPAVETRPATEAPKPIDPARAKAYVAYQEKLLPLQREWAKLSDELEADAKDVTDERATAEARGSDGMENKTGPLAEKLEKVRAESGLTDADLSALSEISGVLCERTDEPKHRLDQIKELRAKYGEAIVDAMLAQEDELRRQNRELQRLR